MRVLPPFYEANGKKIGGQFVYVRRNERERAKFSKTLGKIWRGVPKLGEDTKEVLKRLVGLSEEKLKQLKEKGRDRLLTIF